METALLDLSAYRCPMVLLLAKRRCVQLEIGETLELLIPDESSATDIARYLNENGFTFEKAKQREALMMKIQKIKR